MYLKGNESTTTDFGFAARATNARSTLSKFEQLEIVRRSILPPEARRPIPVIETRRSQSRPAFKRARNAVSSADPGVSEESSGWRPVGSPVGLAVASRNFHANIMPICISMP